MPAPSTAVLEDFNTAGALSASWSKQSGASTPTKAGGVLTMNGGSVIDQWWNATSFQGSIEVFDTITARPSANTGSFEAYLQIMSGWATTAADARSGYIAALNAGTSSDNILVLKRTVGSDSPMGTAVNLGTRMAIGDKWMLRKLLGGAIDVSVFQSGVWSSAIFSASDGTPFFEATPANIGLALWDSAFAWTLDDFGGGLVTGGAAAHGPPRRRRSRLAGMQVR